MKLSVKPGTTGSDLIVTEEGGLVGILRGIDPEFKDEITRRIETPHPTLCGWCLGYKKKITVIGHNSEEIDAGGICDSCLETALGLAKKREG